MKITHWEREAEMVNGRGFHSRWGLPGMQIAHRGCTGICAYICYVVVNYMEMVRADVEKFINDNVIHGIKNKSAFL